MKFLLLGIIIGIFIGLFSLHVNLILPLFWTFGSYFILSLTISWYIFSLIPSILMRVPCEENLIVLNRVNLCVLKGDGLKIIYNSLINFFIILILICLLLPLYSQIIKKSSFIIKIFLVFLIVSFIRSFHSFLIVLFCCILGYITFNINSGNFLFELLSGFFAVPLYLFSENIKFVPQKIPETIEIKKEAFFVPFITIIFSCFPSVSSSIPAYIASKLFNLDIVYCMIFSEFSFLIISLFYLGSIRSGSAYYLSQYSNFDFLNYFFVVLFSLSLSIFLLLYVIKYYKIFLKFYNPKVFLIFVLILSFYLNGFYSILVLFVSSLIGILCNLWNLDRSILLVTLMFPLILV